MSLWDKIKAWKTIEGKQYICHAIPKTQTDATYDETPLLPYQSYFRVWLTQMYLTRSRDWFTDWYPVVHSSVSLGFGSKDKVTFSRVASLSDDARGPGVLRNYLLTDLIPYNGGTVEIDAALLALKGQNSLVAALQVLTSIASLIGPPLDKAVPIATEISKGIANLFEATEGKLHLGLHDGYIDHGGGGGNDLKPGYIAVLLATDRDIDRHRLSVAGDQLLYTPPGSSAPAPLTQFDYMLLRIEKRTERPDWRLADIQDLMDKSVRAFIEGKPEEGEAFRRAALATAVTSADLAMHDRRRVAREVNAHIDSFRDVSHGLTTEREEHASLDDLMKHAMSVDQARNLPPVTLAEFLDQ